MDLMREVRDLFLAYLFILGLVILAPLILLFVAVATISDWIEGEEVFKNEQKRRRIQKEISKRN